MQGLHAGVICCWWRRKIRGGISHGRLSARKRFLFSQGAVEDRHGAEQARAWPGARVAEHREAAIEDGIDLGDSGLGFVFKEARQDRAGQLWQPKLKKGERVGARLRPGALPDEAIPYLQRALQQFDLRPLALSFDPMSGVLERRRTFQEIAEADLHRGCEPCPINEIGSVGLLAHHAQAFREQVGFEQRPRKTQCVLGPKGPGGPQGPRCGDKRGPVVIAPGGAGCSFQVDRRAGNLGDAGSGQFRAERGFPDPGDLPVSTLGRCISDFQPDRVCHFAQAPRKPRAGRYSEITTQASIKSSPQASRARDEGCGANPPVPRAWRRRAGRGMRP